MKGTFKYIQNSVDYSIVSIYIESPSDYKRRFESLYENNKINIFFQIFLFKYNIRIYRFYLRDRSDSAYIFLSVWKSRPCKKTI